MSRADKTLAKMEQNPEGWRYDQVASVLRAHGFTLRPNRGGTSHRTWAFPGVDPVTVVDKGHGTVRGYQVEQAVEAIRESIRKAQEQK